MSLEKKIKKVVNLGKLAIESGGSVIPILIPSKITKGTGLCNPSINKIDGKLKLNLRHIQYTLYHSEGEQRFPNQWGPLAYLNPENDISLTTKNFLCDLDPKTLQMESFSQVDTSKLDVPPLWEFVGLEDARLVKWDNKEYLCGVRRDTTTNGEGRIELSEIKNNKEVARYRIQPPGDYSYCEKNWMPIIDLPFHFVKWTNPTEVIKVDLKTLTSKQIIFTKDIQPFPRDIRGGSQVISYGGYYIALTHEVDLFHNEQKQKDAQYYHRFIVWDKDWNIVNSSDEIKFLTAAIEFSCGMVIHNNSLLISLGFQDNTAYIIQLPLQIFHNLCGIIDIDSPPCEYIETPQLIKDFVMEPYNQQNTFNLAEYYFQNQHTASALSLYLRSAEYGDDDDLIYESLIKLAQCLQHQDNRKSSEKSAYQNAISFKPDRPEAYLLHSQYYESRGDWFTAHTYASIALHHIDNAKPTLTNIGIEDKYVYYFQKAVTCWWVGQGKLSREILLDLILNGKGILSENYKNMVYQNLANLGEPIPLQPQNTKMWHYTVGDKILELNSEGYFLNHPHYAHTLLSEGKISFEEEFINKIIETFSNSKKDFIDIGAHVGTYTFSLSKHFNHVHSFEPNKTVYNYLCGNIALKGLSNIIDTYNLGLSIKEDILTYYERSEDGGGNGFENIVSSEEMNTKLTLPVKTLDSFNFDNVGFIKIDVEGHEKSVLLGAKQTLKNNNSPPILFESWAPGEHSEHDLEYIINLRKELFKVIENYGYSIHEWSSEIFLAVKEQQKPTQIAMEGNINNK